MLIGKYAPIKNPIAAETIATTGDKTDSVLINEHINIMQEEEENLIKITNKIKRVEQPYRNILELRFIEGMKVEEVSVMIDRDYRYTKRLIKKAVKKYAEI